MGTLVAAAERLEGLCLGRQRLNAHGRPSEPARANYSSGPFVLEEIHHVREASMGGAITKQAIAIGLSKARRAGVQLPPSPARAKRKTKRIAECASRAAGRAARPSSQRSRVISSALKREGRGAATRQALSRQAKSASRRRFASARRAAARRPCGPMGSVAKRLGTPHERGRRVAAESQLAAEGVRWARRRERTATRSSNRSALN
jgi:Family of unknown function (DUF6496)